ncbi:C-factor [Erythrobacter sp. QSSC1-22B]|uniref:SDR family NAD(P)-dependent oxidoreductase n=1 Tax=Erythrobacter sp. QSSC1-22B TaxID=1860125 RepID=UPI00080539CB|nr:SDR family NAD(P)-dependent oxidoreductase [Erythrobacter sp. QSSC1-22B]OBX20346.1 C-factor [Erythrobacter sp. QSSC1-22B]
MEHQPFERAAIFGASGGIGRALCQALAERGTRVWALSRSPKSERAAGIDPLPFDLGDENSISLAAETMRASPPQLVMVCTGALTLGDGTGPERSYRQLDGAAMAEAFRINTIGPALIAKHMLALLPRDERSVFGALSARVGSISDNRLGGWHSYRASKAALNMLVRNFAIELGRTHKQASVVALHPGTVDTGLSEPFQANLPEGQLTSPAQAARHLLDVVDRLTPAHSGKAFDWQGEEIPS